MTKAATDNAAIEARRKGARWHLRHVRAHGSDISEADRAAASRAINDWLSRMRTRLAGMDDAWVQELTIAGFAHGATALYNAERFADAALADPDGRHRVAGPRTELSIDAIAAAFERHGLRVAGRPWRALRLSARLGAAAVIGAAGLIVMLRRTRRWPKALARMPETLIALHAEATNRTGHVLRALDDLDPQTHALIVVGRPALDIDPASVLFRSRGWKGEICLAIDAAAVARAIGCAPRLLLPGLAALRVAGFTPPARALAAICFRILLGNAAATWLTRSALPRTVLFGHCGHADTVAMERAAQAGGTRTAHWLHGLSAGQVYAGVSDLLVVPCDHDARWHRRLGGYARTISFPAPKPRFQSGAAGAGWLVLTNFTHFNYTFFRSAGRAHEERLIDEIARLADMEGVARDAVMWKPHPIFYQTDPATCAAITQRIADTGFRLWPRDGGGLTAAAGYETIVSTPSGAAIDILGLGRLPVIAQFHDGDPDQAFARFELRGGTAEALREAMARARDPQLAPAMFDRVWDAIGPGRTPSASEIIGATHASR